MNDAEMINQVFYTAKDIIQSEGGTHILRLVENLEDHEFSSSDISFALAHLVSCGKLSLGKGYKMFVDDLTPYAFTIVN